MKKNKSTNDKIRNIVRIIVILLLGLLVSFILCRKEVKANNKIIEQTVKDAFAFQNMMLVHSLEPNKPGEFTDISSLENETDLESYVSDAAIKTGNSPYYIRVNYGANCVNIYKKDDEGNYTKPYKAMICSSGISTPKSGTYKISYKYRWLSLYGGVYGQYSTRIVNNILFHSVPYFKQRADSLEYEEYDKLGTKASAGCIRLTVQDAKWIYDNITSGTYVEFYSDPNNPGPLGKPTAQKISSNVENRDWDPTDPDKNNPWNGGSGIPTITYTAPQTPTYQKTTKKETSSKQTQKEQNNSNEENETSNSNSSSVTPSKDEKVVEKETTSIQNSEKEETTNQKNENTEKAEKNENTEKNETQTPNNTDNNNSDKTEPKEPETTSTNTSNSNDKTVDSTTETHSSTSSETKTEPSKPEPTPTPEPSKNTESTSSPNQTTSSEPEAQSTSSQSDET